MPLAREVVKDLAVEHGACIRPIQLRRTNLDTGEVDTVLVPCGHTLAHVCPSCAERARTLRAAQCREGWHLEDEPDIDPDPATDDQKFWVEKRAEAQQLRDHAASAGQDTTDLDELLTELDEEITNAGMRGKAAPDRPARRHRSTRRRQDAPDLPRRKVSPRTVGKTYTAPDGKTFRPSLFVTLTCPSYGRVGADGTPADPGAYDYDRAARDALTFAALFDRFIQNLRRYLGYDVQYFAAIEPQRRLAPHVHLAIRGTVVARRAAPGPGRHLPPGVVARCHRPSSTTATSCPSGTRAIGGYLDPATGEVLPTWDQALDAIGDEDEPWHVARFGVRFDAQGVLAGLEGRGPVHRLPDQVPDQAGRRLPPGRHRPRSGRTRPGWLRRCGISRARRGARTGSGTASSPRTPGPAWPLAGARARPTTLITSATPGGGCSSPASGPARRWPTTAPTARTGCCGRSVFRQPTRPGTPGNLSRRATRTIWITPGGCCTSSPIGCDG